MLPFQLPPIIICAPWMVRKGYSGFAFWPFIIFRDRNQISERLLNHERIHLRQQLELLVLPFYILYFLEYGLRRLKQPTWRKAYENISFEREAFAMDSDPDYLLKRRAWSWLGYLNEP